MIGRSRRLLATCVWLGVACGKDAALPPSDPGGPPAAPPRPVPPIRDAALPIPALPTGKLSLRDGRQECAAVALHDGTVLVSGGYEWLHPRQGPGDGLASVERIDLATGTIRDAPSMGRTRYRHTATLLEDGRVLVVGGVGGDAHAVELFEPALDRWREIPSPPSWQRARWGHTATRLADGRVLVAGGILSAEQRVAGHVDIFDPTTERWTTAAPLLRPRDEHGATLLRDGRVLVTGGRAFQPPIGSGIAYLDHAEIYDPTRDRWKALPAMRAARANHVAAVLPDGRVLVAGGYAPEAALASAEIFEPTTGTWTATASMADARFHHSASVLEIGVVVAGGWQRGSNLATTEVFDVATARWRPGPELRVGRDDHCSVALTTGILLFGGQSAKHFSVREVETLPLRAFVP